MRFPAFMFWPERYWLDAYDLTDAEHGIYLRLMMVQWNTATCRMPNDNAWIARKMERSVQAVESEVRPIIQRFFTLDGNWICQKKLREEFERLVRLSERGSEANKHRWGKEKVSSQTDPKKKSVGSIKESDPHPHPHPQGKSLTGISSVESSENPSFTSTNATSLFRDVSLPAQKRDFDFPDWWPDEAWNEFVAMRKKIRAPLTPHAMKLIVTRLTKLKMGGEDPVAVLDQSTRNDWRDVFPVRPDAVNGQSQSSGYDAIVKELMRKDDKP